MANQRDGFEKRGKFWSYRFRVFDNITGKKKEIRISGFLTKAEAQADRRKKELQAQEGNYLKPSTITVQVHFEEWLRAKVALGKIKRATVNQYRGNLDRYIFPKMAGMPLKDLSSAFLQGILVDLVLAGGQGKRPLSKSTVRSVGIVLSEGLDHGVKLGRLGRNPMKEVQTPEGNQKTIEPYSAKEIKTFLEVAKSHRLYGFYRLACYTGARRGEICALLWSDLNFEEGSLSIRKTRGMSDGLVYVQDSTKTKRGMRSVRLDAETVKVMRDHKEKQDLERMMIGNAWQETGYIFAQEDGLPIYPTTPYAVFCSLAKRAGLTPKPLHSLRHHHATELHRAGQSEVYIANRLGDTVQTVLDTYFHGNAQDDQSLGDIYEEVIRTA